MRHAISIALATTVALSACSVADEEPTRDEIGIITYNSLAPDALLSNGDALNTLAGAPLNGAVTVLVNSTAGRSLLSYVVRCALPTGGSATFPVSNGAPLVYTGLLGYAPEWMTGSLTTTRRRLMTGCLMAHVNAFETQVPISVRTESMGDAPLLEKTAFMSQELAVYGNYFAPAADRELYVCFGKAIADTFGASGGLGGLLPSYLDLRICSTSQQCGFNRVGACFRWPSVPSVTTSACEVQAGSFYRTCHEAPFQQQSTPAWEETVTVYLQPLDLTLLLTEYLDLVCTLTGGAVCEDL